MLDALGVGFGRFGRHAQRAQQIDDQPVAHAHPVGKRVAFLGEEDAAIGAGGGKAGAFEPGDRS